MIQITCDYCKKEYLIKGKSYIKKHNFCCRGCYHKYQSENLIGKNNGNWKERSIYYCTYCKKEFNLLDSQANNKKNMFCSKQCRFDYDRMTFLGEGNPNYRNGEIEINCLNCNKNFKRPFYQKDRAKYCSKKCKDEYWSNGLSRTPENQEKLIQQGINSMKKQKNKFTKPELMVYEYLKNKNIECIPQHPMCDRFVVDFFIPCLNIVIEVLGDYWHANPIKYSKDIITERQLKTIERDKIKKETLTNAGYEVYMIWENDIYKNLENEMKFI